MTQIRSELKRVTQSFRVRREKALASYQILFVPAAHAAHAFKEKDKTHSATNSKERERENHGLIKSINLYLNYSFII